MLPSTSGTPSTSRSADESVLTAPRVPTGMNSGVGSSPRGVRTRPTRAAPSVGLDVDREPHAAPLQDMASPKDRNRYPLRRACAYEVAPAVPDERRDERQERRAGHVEVGDDADGGTGRVRVSIVYATRCDGVERQHAAYFPPAQLETIRIAPGVRVPAERVRSGRVAFPPGCAVSGKAFAEATNAHSLESFSDPIWFEYRP